MGSWTPIKNISFVHVFAIILILVGVSNFLMNRTLIFGNFFQKDYKITFSLPEKSKSFLPSTVVVGKTERFTLLFSKFDVSSLNIEGGSKTDFFDGNKRYLTIYEIEGGLNMYLDIKNSVEDTIKSSKEYEKDSKFEANNLGVYSFYYNNDQEKDTVFLVSLIKGTVFAFEYPRVNHENMKIFTKSIVDNL